MSDQLSRRTTLAGAAGLTVGLPVLAACGGGGGGSSASETPRTKTGTVVGPTNDVPVGGGKIYGDLNLVVTQPESGTFKAFSATCTHQGCQVGSVSKGTIDCPCHLSKFSIDDGSVEGGPASRPLPKVAITVANGQITVA
ncbi:Rieske (2Fe-2S) protein [Nocardioides sp. CER19]|uniref:Rieske (2Fe-2S) protein n=1 Tax=Nocardioides sp. CER19 TaxID=3038538 RepID=UPI002448578C|nr:Rieske (2Fe-2S) protein [Nocardioides sp. CER19]MDH2415802.1 Rieske (2Fe-2S) protein [Nocardioides sp. CER19]